MSKQLPWFRVYTRMVDDDKLKLLAFEDRWHFVALLCLKGEGLLDNGDAPSLLMRKIAVKLGLDVRSLEEVARRLAEVGLIDQVTLQPAKWDGLQQRSDADSTAADRKRRQREREKDANKEPVAPTFDDTDVSRVTVTNVTRTDKDLDKEEEINTEAKASSSTSKLPDCPHLEILDLFAEHLPTLPQPKPELWTGQRAKHLVARWRWCLTAKKRSGDRYATDKASGLDFFARYLAYVAKSDFLTGRNGQWGGCDLAWLAKEENFAKVLQGNYENKNQEGA